MELKRNKKDEIYGRDVEERYKFIFGNGDGELKSVERKVRIDSDGSGYTTTDAVERTEIELSQVPDDIREDVADSLMNAAEEV